LLIAVFIYDSFKISWEAELAEKNLLTESVEKRLGELDNEMNLRRALIELLKYPYE
jgi:hypothetical protein